MQNKKNFTKEETIDVSIWNKKEHIGDLRTRYHSLKELMVQLRQIYGEQEINRLTIKKYIIDNTENLKQLEVTYKIKKKDGKETFKKI